MQINITATPEEIAALVVAIQERQIKEASLTMEQTIDATAICFGKERWDGSTPAK